MYFIISIYYFSWCASELFYIGHKIHFFKSSKRKILLFNVGLPGLGTLGLGTPSVGTHSHRCIQSDLSDFSPLIVLYRIELERQCGAAHCSGLAIPGRSNPMKGWHSYVCVCRFGATWARERIELSASFWLASSSMSHLRSCKIESKMMEA